MNDLNDLESYPEDFYQLTEKQLFYLCITYLIRKLPNYMMCLNMP